LCICISLKPRVPPAANQRSAALAAVLLPSPAPAADADRGKDIAQTQCAACHTIAPYRRNEVADAQPFDVIGRKNGFDADMLAFSMLEPHPKMNFTLTRREAADVAAYISTLAK
jgi:mono/diheme cytochrome c family protein